LLARQLPGAALELTWDRLDHQNVEEAVRVCEDHDHVQGLLAERGFVAFIRDGSILPRASGVSSRPLEGAVPFRSPESMHVILPTLHHGEVTGMGIPAGVVLITGGGFHGKSTLLQAIQYGMYPHVPGDGREWVVTRDDAVKVRSEDGRSVAGVDLRPFIHDLPGDRDTASFTTPDASGSTSLAAGILESMEMGAGILLLDEDTSATNLLIRDARMQSLVRKETITPLIDRVRDMHAEVGVSTILVVGGSGDYLDVADTVILMEDYVPREVSEEARSLAGERPTGRAIGDPVHPMRITPRRPLARSFDPRRGRREKIKAHGLRELVFGEEVIDLAALEQLVDDSQARAIGVLLKRIGTLTRSPRPLREVVEELMEQVAEHGLGRLDPSPELALPRSFEVAGAVNRLRSLEVESRPSPAGD
jgi:predicted ABC-class ATPase